MMTLDFTLNGKPVIHQTRLALTEVSWLAVGGCEAARITATGAADALWLWATRLLADLDIYAPDTTRIWAGVLWAVTLQTPWGTFDYSLDKLCNRVAVEYSYATDGTVGDRALTDWGEDAASIARYGTIEQLISGDGMTPELADAYRDQYLALYAWPTPLLNPGSRSERVTCEMVAFGHWARLQHQIYSDTATGQLDTAAIAQLIAGDFAWVSDDMTQVTASGITTSRHRSNNYTGQQEMVNLQEAGSTAGRVIAGIDAQKRLYFKPVSDALGYYWRKGEPHNTNLQQLDPWQVQPGAWAEQIDVIAPTLVDVIPPGRFFVERVTLNAAGTGWDVGIEPPDAQTLEKLILGG
ncbi:MAG: hypothetical protein M0R37_10660 [Bacteroidales bacterium]|jgi:hypothetical protein|nr:hypothetical protein [Bacteroidales bacterium]